MEGTVIQKYLHSYEVGPLWIRRNAFLADKIAEDPQAVPLVKQLLSVILAPKSKYRLYRETPHLIKILEVHGETSEAARFAREFDSILESSVAGNASTQVMKLNELYDQKMSVYEEGPVNQESFDAISALLEQKSLDLLMSTSSSESTSDNTSFYYNIDPRYLAYYRKVSLRNLEDYMIHRNYDNGLGDSLSFLSRKVSQLVTYDKDIAMNEEDIQSMATDSYDEDLHVRAPAAGAPVAAVDETDHTSLSEPEIVSYWHCRWYLTYANFLGDRYSKVVSEVDDILNGTMPFVSDITGIRVLQSKYDNKLVCKTDLIRCICLSMLISKNNVELRSSLNVPFIKEALVTDATLSLLVKSYTDSKFSQFLQVLEDLKSEYSYDYQLSMVFPNVQRILVLKSYALYLSMIKRVSVSHMASAFGVPVKGLRKDISMLVTVFGLTLKLDTANDIIEYQVTSSKFNALAEEVVSVSEAAKISSRVLEVNSLVLGTLPEAKQPFSQL